MTVGSRQESCRPSTHTSCAMNSVPARISAIVRTLISGRMIRSRRGRFLTSSSAIAGCFSEQSNLSGRRLCDIKPYSMDLHRSVFNFCALHIQFPDRCSIRFPADLCKAKLLVVHFRQVVALSGKILTNQLADTSPLAVRKHFLQHHVLHASSQHTTAHQPGVEFPNALASQPADHDTDHAVIAKAISQSNLQGETVRVVLSRSDLRFTVTACREVVLVRLVDKLRNPRPPSLIKRLERYHHLERCQVRINIAELFL